MKNTENKLWSFYTDDEDALLGSNEIALPDGGEGDLSRLPETRGEFRKRFETAVKASLLYRFAHEMRVGDYVLLRTAHGSPVELGRVTGDYRYGGAHRRSVQWIKRFQHDEISSGAMRELTYASASRLFPVTHYAAELLGKIGVRLRAADTARAEKRSAVPGHAEPSGDVRDFVLGELGCQPAYRGCKEFIAGLLQAMGYRVTMVAAVGDSADMVAHRDELMPRVLVKVKNTGVTAADVEALARARDKGDCGFLFTLGELSGDVRAALAKADLRGIDGAELAELTLKYYAALDERYRRIIPLKTVFVPVA